MVEPISIMAMIGAGLSLIDQFTDLTDRWQDRKGDPHRGKAEVKDDVLTITHDITNKDEEPELVQLAHIEANLDVWDGQRYQMLGVRTKNRWVLLQKYEAQNVGLSPTERGNLEYQTETTLADLCKDFHEMIEIIQRVTNHYLPDHYQLYHQCGTAP